MCRIPLSRKDTDVNAIDRARNAYAPNRSPVRTERAAEVELFRQTNALLKAATTPPQSMPKLVDALHQNRKVWTHMAGEVADSDNALPSELRASLLYLYKFVASHTAQILRGAAEVGPLIDINTAIIRGLKGEGAN